MTHLPRPSADQRTIESEPCPRALGRSLLATRRWALVACVLASSMAFIDGTALTVALPSLKQDLGADLASVQ
ncbi:MAG: MFS transporter, partial [Myxococcota bacterium]